MWLAAAVVVVEQEEEEEASEADLGCHPDVEGPNPSLGASEAGTSPVLGAIKASKQTKSPIYTTAGRCQTLSIESKSRKRHQDPSK